MSASEEIANYALRYALGRASYAPHSVIEFIRLMRDKSDNFRSLCRRDIMEHLERWPDTYYAKEWHELADDL